VPIRLRLRTRADSRDEGRQQCSTALLALAASYQARGDQVIVLAPRTSPLRSLAGRAGVIQVFTSADVSASAELRPRMGLKARCYFEAGRSPVSHSATAMCFVSVTRLSSIPGRADAACSAGIG